VRTLKSEFSGEEILLSFLTICSK